MEEPELSRFDPSQRHCHADIDVLNQNIVRGCKTCGGIGFVNDSRCVCSVEMNAICGLDWAGVPREYWQYELSKMPINNALLNEFEQAIAAYSQNASAFAALNLLISGPYRIGKTTLATSMMKRLLWYDYRTSVVYTTANDLVACSRHKDEGEKDFTYLASVGLLIIDEIGKELLDEWRQKRSWSILDGLLRRRRGNRPTILITNLTMQELRSCYGENLYTIFLNDFRFLDCSGLPQLGVRRE